MSLKAVILTFALALTMSEQVISQQDTAPPSRNPFDRPAFMLELTTASQNSAAPPSANIKLKATLVSNGKAYVNITGQILGEGEEFGGIRVLSIAEGRAIVRFRGERMTLDVYKQQMGSSSEDN